LCEQLNIPFQCVRVNVPRKTSAGLEASARKARYAALTQAGANALALAHHLDDQAETVLFQLLRGGEPRALAAMPDMRLHENMPLLRPLLNVPKIALVHYAHRHRLAWVEDDSNADTALSRNALRHDILPLLERYFPDYRERLSGVAQRMAEVAQLLEGMAGADIQTSDEIDIAVLDRLPEARARNLLAHFLRERRVALPRPAAMRELLRQLLEARGKLNLPLPDGSKLVSSRGKIRVEKPG
jgi:tRNA(Ile)-lysidine synthase